ncbi:class II peroxidase [Lophiostoma macrostomum CBS 122681]|uniref:Peroxidase n=1 Tax=Lophiostoma macrostomum CBS 122681 TaxID=1314788 RepID=A0A6A6SYJ6_9PLEO|nr:class II peroxidase [Lophiostoma macrostomum CBS 122681]
MYISSFVTLLAAASYAQALQLSDITSSCPAVWSDISTALTAQYLADGQCTDAARAAIRAAFHDCFNGACDGSLILAGECTNSENNGLQTLCTNLGSLAQNKSVGVADLIQFAGAHAIKTCPSGPTVAVKVGRTDSSTPAPLGILPAGNASSSDLLASFQSKGFTTTDLVALIGAHSTAKQFTTDPSQAGASLDSTPGEWDTKFYSETQDGTAPFTLPADKNLADDSASSGEFSRFARSQPAWAAAFAPAMEKMSMVGVTDTDLIDCTSALPGGSSKRDIKRASVFDRLKW